MATLKRRSSETQSRSLIYDGTYDEKRKQAQRAGAIVRPPGADRPAGGGMKGVKRSSLSSARAPWFTVDDIFSLALVGAYRTTALDNGEPLDILFRIIARARATGPFYFAGPTVSPLPRDNALFYTVLFLFYFAFFLPFLVALFFGSRSLFVASSHDVDVYSPKFRGSRGTDL